MQEDYRGINKKEAVMGKNYSFILQRIINEKSREYSLKKREYSDDIVSIFREEWHLFSWLNNPLVPTLEIQGSISDEGDYIRTVWFPHPTLITPETQTEFILFANEANMELHSGGRFWCNEEMDFAYEIVLSKASIEACEEDETARLLIDMPLVYFQDLQIPLTMLRSRTWEAHTAIKYLRELRTEGFVDNSGYGLF